MFCAKKQRRSKTSKSKDEEQQRNRKGWRKIAKKYLRKTGKKIIKDEANGEKNLIGIKRGQGNKKQEKKVYKQCHGVKRKPRRIKLLQLCEGFQL